MKPTPFQIFCGYYLGLDKEFAYRFFNQGQLAAHLGMDPEELRHCMEEFHLTPEITRHVDYNLARAHATAQELFDEGRRDDVIDHARRSFEEFRQALVRYDPSKDFENVDYDRLFPGMRRRGRTTMLSIDDLRVLYANPRSPVEAVAGLSLEVPPGRAVALVGESGSGKSTVVTALLGLLPPSARVSGRVVLDGVDVLSASPEVLRGLRGRRVGFVGQAPHSAFDPLFAVDAQLREAWRAHEPGGGPEARDVGVEGMDEALEEALEAAGLDLSGAAAGLPPHRMSGGMLQRAQIAAAMLHRPPLLVADEPTSALDTVLARRLADALRALKSGGTSVLLATHDLGLAAELADEVVVMRGGRVVERGPWADVLGNPKDAYTLALVAAHPSRGLRVRPGVTE